eukprot:1790078-Rhodomonas_salina.2
MHEPDVRHRGLHARRRLRVSLLPHPPSTLDRPSTLNPQLRFKPGTLERSGADAEREDDWVQVLSEAVSGGAAEHRSRRRSQPPTVLAMPPIMATPLLYIGDAEVLLCRKR